MLTYCDSNNSIHPPRTSETATSTRIVIAYEHDLVRSALNALLQGASYEVCAEARDGDRAVQIVREERPDILLLGIDLPPTGATGVLRTLNAQPHTRVVILCPGFEEWKCFDAMRNGANGIVGLDCTAAELHWVIRKVLTGEQHFPESLRTKTVRFAVGFGFRRSSFPTNREYAVLQLAAQGLTSSEIGEKLSISRRTAEAHRANVMRKLGLKNQTDLVLYAVRNGIVSA